MDGPKLILNHHQPTKQQQPGDFCQVKVCNAVVGCGGVCLHGWLGLEFTEQETSEREQNRKVS